MAVAQKLDQYGPGHLDKIEDGVLWSANKVRDYIRAAHTTNKVSNTQAPTNRHPSCAVGIKHWRHLHLRRGQELKLEVKGTREAGRVDSLKD